MRLIRALLVTLFAMSWSGSGDAGDLMIAPRSPFVAQFGELSTSYRVLGVFVLPGERVPIAAWPVGLRDEYSINAAGGTLQRTAANTWNWEAPRTPGLYPIEIRPMGGMTAITLNAFVMVPLSDLKGGSINGYRIGSYPRARAANRNAAAYTPPRGFIEVTPATEQALVSPHFRVGQFVTKQGGAYPRYLVLREALPMKLEAILEEAHRQGLPARTFTVMSGYRTPSYNSGLGTAQLSRHQYGDASDIFVDDAPVDGRMDDLNRDGRVDVADSRRLSQIVEWLSTRPGAEEGGLGVYSSTPSHGPFVHVDARGFRARWSGAGVATADIHPPEGLQLETSSPSTVGWGGGVRVGGLPKPRVESQPVDFDR
jgi:hypothetical protein